MLFDDSELNAHPGQRLLTDEEAVRWLGLDYGRKNPREALRTLRRMGKLGFVKVGRRILYPVDQIERYIREASVDPRGD
jgi:hypothetical protein